MKCQRDNARVGSGFVGSQKTEVAAVGGGFGDGGEGNF